MGNHEAEERWWSERSVPPGGLAWSIGPLSLQVQRVADEWQVWHSETTPEAVERDWSVAAIDQSPSELGSFTRFAVPSSDDHVRLSPRPADRSVVARPRAPLHVLAGEDARIFISAPVWIEVAVGRPPRALCEIPSRRLTDTWFGTSTREGEVAYGLKTHAHARLENLPRSAYRAVTPVRIRNRGDDTLALDRMNLPVPYLSIYRDAAGALWTEAVTLARVDDNQMASFEIAAGPPADAREAHRIGQPRVVASGHPLVRAFGRLIRPFEEED